MFAGSPDHASRASRWLREGDVPGLHPYGVEKASQAGRLDLLGHRLRGAQVDGVEVSARIEWRECRQDGLHSLDEAVDALRVAGRWVVVHGVRTL